MEKHVTFVGALHIGYNAIGILAAMAVFMFIGVYSIWVLAQDETAKMFASGSAE